MAYRIASGDALLQETWESKLWDESQERDIFSGLVGTYSDKEKTIPDAAVMRVNLQPSANSHTLGLLLDLTGSGVQGAGKTLLNNTESFNTRDYTVYSNDVRHGVDTEQYGFYAHLNEKYGMLRQAQPALSKWYKARRGKHAREGLLQLFSDNLTESPNAQTQGWNKNWLVKNVAATSQPTYDSTLSQFTANIVTALTAAGTSTATALDPQFFTDLEYYITNIWKIKPFADGSYIVTVPSRQAVYLKRMSESTASMTSFAGVQNQSGVEKYVDAAYGQYLMRYGKLNLIVDDRAPIINYDSSTGTPTAYYRDVGSTDDRSDYTNTGSNNVFDIGFVLGAGGLTETISMKPRFDDDITDFNRLKSIGVSMGYGMQATEFDATTASDTTRINQSSAVFAAYSGTFTS